MPGPFEGMTLVWVVLRKPIQRNIIALQMSKHKNPQGMH